MAEPLTLLGYEAKLTLDIDGELFDITGLIQIESEVTGKGIHISATELARAVDMEHAIRRRLLAKENA